MDTLIIFWIVKVQGIRRLTESETLSQDATRRHVLLLLQFSKVGGGGKDQDVCHGHDALEDGHSLLDAEALVRLQDVNLTLTVTNQHSHNQHH